MTRPVKLSLLATLGILAGVGSVRAWHYALDSDSPVRSALVSTAYAADVSERATRSREIVFFERRAAEDPYSAGDQAELARRLLQRGRTTGNYNDILRAEQSARRSLELRTQHNSKAFAILATTLVEQHRFVEARDIASQLVALEPETSAYRAMLGEIQLELGDYDSARLTFGYLRGARHDLDVAPRLARWAELSGRTPYALKLLLAARREALARADLPRQQVAWFHLRVGDLELRNGRLEEAGAAFVAGLDELPGDYRLLAAMARLEAARQHWTTAIEYGELATAEVLDPATLALMSEIHAAMGDTSRAAEYARVTEVSLLNSTGAFHRAESLFLLDRGHRVAEISVQAAEDVRTRRDVYGYDLLAWALHKQGRHEEAGAAMASALRLGTRDAMLFYHAGMIDRARGNKLAAKAHLARALEVNPTFHPVHAPAARAELDSIRREGSWRSRLPF